MAGCSVDFKVRWRACRPKICVCFVAQFAPAFRIRDCSTAQMKPNVLSQPTFSFFVSPEGESFLQEGNRAPVFEATPSRDWPRAGACLAFDAYTSVAHGRSREAFMNLRLAKHVQNLLGFPSAVKAIFINRCAVSSRACLK